MGAVGTGAGMARLEAQVAIFLYSSLPEPPRGLSQPELSPTGQQEAGKTGLASGDGASGGK